MFGLFKRKEVKIDFNDMRAELYGKGNQATKRSKANESTDALYSRLEQESQAKYKKMRADAEAAVPPNVVNRQQMVEQVFADMLHQDEMISLAESAVDYEHNKHMQLIAALEDIKDEVRRGNVAANMIDEAKRHPFLTGFLATEMYHRAKSK